MIGLCIIPDSGCQASGIPMPEQTRKNSSATLWAWWEL